MRQIIYQPGLILALLLGPATEQLLAQRLPLDQFTYLQVDASRQRPPAFGLALGDVTGDRLGDIVSGRYLYHNPGPQLTGAWRRVELPGGTEIDAMLIVDVDGDPQADLIAERLPDVLWLEAEDSAGTRWSVRAKIGQIPRSRHQHHGQGYQLAQLIPGGKPEILLASNGVYYFEIPDQPHSGNWPRTTIHTAVNSEEGLGVGDVDGDGDLDVCGSSAKDPPDNPVGWYENPGVSRDGWNYHRVGTVAKVADRHHLVDLNGDRRRDIVVSAANGKADGVYWFEAPADPRDLPWRRHTVVVQPFCNSLDVADMDRDGDTDLIVQQHRDERRLQVFENDGRAMFTPHLIDQGKEGHLGARTADLDGDGDQDIVSIAWDQFELLHLWRNDAISADR